MQNPKRRALKHIFCLLLHGYVDKIKNSNIKNISKMILRKKNQNTIFKTYSA